MRLVAIAKWLFLGVGLAMLVGAALLANATRGFLARAVSAQGTVVDLEASSSKDSDGRATTYYRPIVQFVAANGERLEVRSRTGSNPPSHARGETVEVLYAPDEPRSARIRGFFELWGGAAILGGIGGVFSAIGGGIFAFGALRRRRREWLRRNGTRIDATFQRVEENAAITVQGRHPYRIVAQWLDPAKNEVHVFRSEDLWFDPAPYLRSRDGAIPVLVERGNPKRYWVDLSFLPKLAA